MRAHTHTLKKLHVVRALRGERVGAIRINLVNMESRRILPYSDMNRIANETLLYSVLNPETSSDSPSEKSKGVRFDSATQEISQRAKAGRHKKRGA